MFTHPLVPIFSCFLAPSLLSPSVPSPLLSPDTGIFSYTQSHSPSLSLLFECLSPHHLHHESTTVTLSSVLLMNPGEHTASPRFRLLLTLQTCHPLPQIQLLLWSSSLLEVDASLLEEAAFYYLGSDRLDFRSPCPLSTQGVTPSVPQLSQVFPGKCCVAHARAHTHPRLCCKRVRAAENRHPSAAGRLVCQSTPTSEVSGFTPPSHRYSLLLLFLSEHQMNFQDKTTTPHSLIPIHLITFIHCYFSFSHPRTAPSTSPSTFFCQSLESSLPTHRKW